MDDFLPQRPGLDGHFPRDAGHFVDDGRAGPRHVDHYGRVDFFAVGKAYAFNPAIFLHDFNNLNSHPELCTMQFGG